jgi:hypothetical protein
MYKLAWDKDYGTVTSITKVEKLSDIEDDWTGYNYWYCDDLTYTPTYSAEEARKKLTEKLKTLEPQQHNGEQMAKINITEGQLSHPPEEYTDLQENDSIVGKTIEAVGSTTVPGNYGREPCTVLFFTDMTSQNFVHPIDE